MTDVVATREQAAALEREPLLVLEPLRAFLDTFGLGAGSVEAHPIGDGHSNVTYAIDRGRERFVLRRPPRGPLAPSTHDVLREARLLVELGAAGIRVPEILAVCDDEAVIGAPFYVMAYVDGDVLTDRLPKTYAGAGDPEAIAGQLVDALVELHAVDARMGNLPAVGWPHGYLERQIRRFGELLDQNATRPLPALHQVRTWLETNRPTQSETTVVHGDYRLGNVLFSARPEPRVLAILDWEMATLGDPLADVGYLTVMWAQADDPEDPMLALSAVTRRAGFPDRRALADRYAVGSGRDLAALGWYQVLALWKSAIFLESSYWRYLAGSTDDRYFARLAMGVPGLARRALRHAAGL